ncbi:hypothetical protein [Aeromonas popoffii]|uniref:hypothetical protein n=1 Tax=Aeromonas popoffii TaxID=70856 RepID=UPI000A63130D|nr:hypothetical protein [Aeromonas popoffii]
MNISSEMIHSLLPLFMVTVLGYGLGALTKPLFAMAPGSGLMSRPACWTGRQGDTGRGTAYNLFNLVSDITSLVTGLMRESLGATFTFYTGAAIADTFIPHHLTTDEKPNHRQQKAPHNKVVWGFSEDGGGGARRNPAQSILKRQDKSLSISILNPTPVQSIPITYYHCACLVAYCVAYSIPKEVT